jgi:hypothetical protein
MPFGRAQQFLYVQISLRPRTQWPYFSIFPVFRRLCATIPHFPLQGSNIRTGWGRGMWPCPPPPPPPTKCKSTEYSICQQGEIDSRTVQGERDRNLNRYRGWILGRIPYKSHKSFPPCYSQVTSTALPWDFYLYKLTQHLTVSLWFKKSIHTVWELSRLCPETKLCAHEFGFRLVGGGGGDFP